METEIKTETLHDRILAAPHNNTESPAARLEHFYINNFVQMKRVLRGDGLIADLRRDDTYTAAFNLGLNLVTQGPLLHGLSSDDLTAISKASTLLRAQQGKLLTANHSIYAKFYARFGTSV